MGLRSGIGRVAATVALAAIAVGAIPDALAYRRPGRTERASVSSHEREQDTPFDWVSDLGYPVITPNGRYVVFQSRATNLTGDRDDGYLPDVFLRDRKTGRTELISRSSRGLRILPDVVNLDRASNHPDVSGDGRYVVFESDGLLAPDDDDGSAWDIYVRDRKADVTSLITKEGKDALGGYVDFFNASISRNGRYITLIGSDHETNVDLFFADRVTGKIRLLSKTATGSASAGVERCADLSPDGRLVVIETDEAYASGDSNGANDVYLLNIATGKMERVSRSGSGDLEGNSTPCMASGRQGSNISQDGRFVIFNSMSQNLVPNDRNGFPLGTNSDTFVRDRKTDRVLRVSVFSSGAEATGGPNGGQTPVGSISGNGRIATFAGQINGCPSADGSGEVHAYDIKTGALECLALSYDGGPGETGPGTSRHGSTNFPMPDFDGRYITFTGLSVNLVRNDTNQIDDVFVRDRGLPLRVGQLVAAGKAKAVELRGSPRFAETGFAKLTDIVDDPHSLSRATDLIGGRIVYRPLLNDIFVVLETDHMPLTPMLAAETAGMIYGLSFSLDGHPYELRATSTGLGARLETTAAFGLFDCGVDSHVGCLKIADVEGGFGTTGHRITIALPTEALGINNPSALSALTGFTAIGTLVGGPQELLDQVVVGR